MPVNLPKQSLENDHVVVSESVGQILAEPLGGEHLDNPLGKARIRRISIRRRYVVQKAHAHAESAAVLLTGDSRGRRRRHRLPCLENGHHNLSHAESLHLLPLW